MKLINTLQITQKKRYDREMGSSEVMVEKFSRQQAKTDSVEEAGLRSLIDAEAGKRAAWALLIMWALHRKSPSHNLRPSTNWRGTSRRLLEGVGAYLAKERVSVAKKQCNIPNGTQFYIWQFCTESGVSPLNSLPLNANLHAHLALVKILDWLNLQMVSN